MLRGAGPPRPVRFPELARRRVDRYHCSRREDRTAAKRGADRSARAGGAGPLIL